MNETLSIRIDSVTHQSIMSNNATEQSSPTGRKIPPNKATQPDGKNYSVTQKFINSSVLIHFSQLITLGLPQRITRFHILYSVSSSVMYTTPFPSLHLLSSINLLFGLSLVIPFLSCPLLLFFEVSRPPRPECPSSHS